MNDRLRRLRQKNLAQTPEICSERARIVTEAYEQFQDLPAALLRARTLEKILREMSIWIADDELIVGNQASMAKGTPVFPEFSVDWIMRELDQFEMRRSSKYKLSAENKAVLKEVLPKWKGRTVKERALSVIPDEAKEAMACQAFLLSPLSCGLGHISVQYEKLIDRGLEYLIDELTEKKAHCRPENAADLERGIFYDSCLIVCNALIAFAERFAALAEQKAAASEEPRRAELLEIARVCRKVPRQRAETFQEALQSFWFLHLCLQIESNGHSMSPGRFDQYTIRSYNADMERGISPQREEELLGCLWVKFAEISKLRDYTGSLAFGGYPMFQNLIVGGMDADGRDVTNAVSLLCCKVTAELKLSQPSLSMRWHKGTPESMKRSAAEVARAGIGMPAYFNDEAIIPILRNIGCSLEEARNYCEVGCVEPHVAGKMEGMYSTGFTNLCKVLELAIFNGEDPVSGKKIGIPVGEAFEDFHDFYNAYRKEQRYIMDLHAFCVNAVEYAHSAMCPTPLVSCFVEDCIERGKDIRCGGAHYNYTSPNAVGLANLGDSMLVIKKKVFENHKYSMEEMRKMLRCNFHGYETVRQEFLHNVPKYGNDDDEADLMTRICGEDYCRDFKRYTGYRSASFQPGLQSISAHALFVGSLGATPDGRTKEMLVSDGGVSPAQGRDVCGPTAEMLSVAKLNHFEATNGALLNVKFHPSTVQGEKGLQNLCALTDAFFNLGAQHVQYNVVDSEVLRDAQKHPEKYSDLVVRVAGFSVLFTTLDVVLQNDIIERTQHACC
ncbi:formate C-acetyltransferase/glycerol dehydratase family glycyl radical enzyme [Oscillibacter sp.]|uniref:glycyl radical protein n=1 Tax=Oscillibacter sp. TaxID=1945593 RepID=UPI00261DFAFC|nr:formate C-acetyltransferase/glycerol dehydratase family glycyl radical enzyme [Oscillibacter sp.]MDD3347165.1 formate C-acetyltransferase/glycerol dehydratase family glycyl radical enzyme [Oscillibacter sp.]